MAPAATWNLHTTRKNSLLGTPRGRYDELIRPFCITILYHNYCYSSIYFIFRVDTYVISFVSTCLMIIGGFAIGVRILLEKGPSKDHILKIRKIPKKYQEIIFFQKTQKSRRRCREEPGGPHTPGWCGQPPSRASPA
jgi:hypothetical protein